MRHFWILLQFGVVTAATQAANLLFHAPLDGSPVAAFAAGEPAPLVAEGLDWGDGPLPGTRALRMTGPESRLAGRAAEPPHGKNPPRLAYSAAGNLPRDSGTVALWTKREWNFSDGAEQPFRTLFATPMPHGIDKGRIGSGALWFWWQDSRLRADQSDSRDRYARCESLPLSGEWMHLAFTWRPGRVELFVNGERRRHLRDMDSPIRDALAEAEAARNPPDRSAIERFFVGCSDSTGPADSLIADLRIYDAPLAAEEVKWIFEETRDKRPATCDELADMRLTTCDSRTDGSHSRAPLPGEAPGTIDPSALELVAEVFPASCCEGEREAPHSQIFRSVGPLRVGELATPDSRLSAHQYLEAGPRKCDRFAVRLRLPADVPLFLVEIDVPDDALRTEDLILQPCDGASDYAMQVGLLLGGEYPNSGRIITHRCLYWARTNDVALVAMTARDGAPAAVAAIRAYAVRDSALPFCPVPGTVCPVPGAEAPVCPVPGAEAPVCPVPGAEAPGLHRHAALYYEDPALNLQFGLPSSATSTPEGFAEELSRLAATMKFTGQDALFYPGAWYQGLIEAGGYNPRNHAPRWREILYNAFDREGLSFVPTINLNNIPWEPGAVTVESLTNGTLHPTPIAIHDTGKPNPGLWHNTPPNYNFFHPAVQAEIERIFDTLVSEGAAHPSFGGVCLHLTQHCCLWWGSDKSGYNDYAVEAFCRDRGLKPPAPIARALEAHPDAQAPSCAERGRDYAEWLRSDPALWKSWIQWRCDQVTSFYARLAAKLAAAHPGAALYVNNFVPPDVKHPDFGDPGFIHDAARRAGLDVPALEAAAPNVVVMQTSVPADYRWGYVDRYFRFEDAASRASATNTVATLDATPGFWSLLGEASRPWAHQHDRYWESAIGARGDTLSCAWMKECAWRVSTLNPAGASALSHFTRPLRFHDALGLSKGGFLVGTYGMEAQLAPFLAAFRSLPPIVLPELPSSTELVKVRGGEWRGTNYLYAVNTGDTPAEVALQMPPEAAELGLVESRAEPQSRREANITLRKIALAPNSLRAFAWPVSLAPSAEAPIYPVPKAEALGFSLPPGARIEGQRLVVEIPANAPVGARVAHCVAAFDPQPFLPGGHGILARVGVSGYGVSEPDHPWNGVKFMFHYREGASGIDRWPGARLPRGSFTNAVAEIRLTEFDLGGAPKDNRVELILGLEGCTGRVEFDLSSLRLESEDYGFVRTNQDYIVRYPLPATPAPSVAEAAIQTTPAPPVAEAAIHGGRAKAPPLRGCMLPGRATREEDIETLHQWGATLVRFQITRNWSKVDDNQDLAEYARWVDSRLDNLEQVLGWCAARGMKVCIDLHALPGGKRGFNGRPYEMNMFHEKKYLDAFIDTWRRIATRCAPIVQTIGPVIYGYDLVNEPNQRGPVQYDYWTVQRLAAEAVREIDPDTPIVVESDLADRAWAFRYLSPLAMDNVIYQCHMYEPTIYTHQGIFGPPPGPGGTFLPWPGRYGEQIWDKETIRRELEPVLEFQRRHKCKIYVGEFSAAAYAPGAENYLRDCIDLFEEYGWDWTYHAFREAPCWDVDKEGPNIDNLRPAATNTPRKNVLLDGFSR